MTAPATKVPATPAPASATKAPAKKERKPRTSADIPDNESAEQRFKRVAAPRVSKAVAALRRLETVGRSPSYGFSLEQANRVMKYVDEATERVRMAFVNRVNDRKAEDQITL